MAEKITLLNSIPVEDESDDSSGNKKISLLSKTKPVEKDPNDSEAGQLVVDGSAATLGTQDVAVQLTAIESSDEGESISGFQMMTYGSFILSFVFAGVAALVLFRKASRLAEERFIVSSKMFAGAAILIALHGIFATYLYASYLNSSDGEAPLVLTMAIWVLVGPIVGFIMRALLARQEKMNVKAAIVDASFYGVIFAFAVLGLGVGLKTNAALLFSILSGFLMIVPIARSLTVYKVARARHQELNAPADKILVYSLLLLPALLPLVSFLSVCGVSDDVTLFLINFITFDFVLIAGLSMIASADELVVSAPEEAAASEAVEKDTSVAAYAESAPVNPVVSSPAAVPVGSVDTSDPIIQFLNSEEGANSGQPTKSLKSVPAGSTMPPRRPKKPGAIVPPKKPGGVTSEAPKDAPNAPSRLKAPAKPKKRF